MAVCPPPNVKHHETLCAWGAQRPQLRDTLQELSRWDVTRTTASSKSPSVALEGWASVRLGTRAPFVWQLQWCRALGPFLLLFENNQPTAPLTRAIYIPGTTPVALSMTHPDSCKRPSVLFMESLYGACFAAQGAAEEPESPLVWQAALVDQRRTFLYFETKDDVFRWKLKLGQISAARSEYCAVQFGQPMSINHLVRINETPTSKPGQARGPGEAPQGDLPKNFGAQLLPPAMLQWLKSQGLTEEDVSKHTPQEWSDMRQIVDGTSEKVGPNSRQNQFRKLDPKKRVTLADLVSPEPVEQLYADLVLVDQGMQGKVFRATSRATNGAVAVKKVVLRNESTELPPLINEIHVLSLCKHNNIVQLLSCHQRGKEISIVMEYMSGGKLTDIIDTDEGIGIVFAEKEIATIMYEVACGLAYLHENGIMHRDIKSDNILVNKVGDIKLGDFGFATNILTHSGAISSRKTLVGTPYWMAPEITKGHDYDFKADNWSLGILFLELCDGIPPWMGVQPIKALSKISLSPPPKISGTRRSLSHLAHEFAAFVLVKDPARRPSSQDIVRHPFLAAANRLPSTTFMRNHVEQLLVKKGRAQ